MSGPTKQPEIRITQADGYRESYANSVQIPPMRPADGTNTKERVRARSMCSKHRTCAELKQKLRHPHVVSGAWRDETFINEPGYDYRIFSTYTLLVQL